MPGPSIETGNLDPFFAPPKFEGNSINPTVQAGINEIDAAIAQVDQEVAAEKAQEAASKPVTQ